MGLISDFKEKREEKRVKKLILRVLDTYYPNCTVSHGNSIKKAIDSFVSAYLEISGETFVKEVFHDTVKLTAIMDANLNKMDKKYNVFKLWTSRAVDDADDSFDKALIYYDMHHRDVEFFNGEYREIGHISCEKIAEAYCFRNVIDCYDKALYHYYNTNDLETKFIHFVIAYTGFPNDNAIQRIKNSLKFVKEVEEMFNVKLAKNDYIYDTFWHPERFKAYGVPA